jgi:hypothetical protein
MTHKIDIQVEAWDEYYAQGFNDVYKLPKSGSRFLSKNKASHFYASNFASLGPSPNLESTYPPFEKDSHKHDTLSIQIVEDGDTIRLNRDAIHTDPLVRKQYTREYLRYRSTWPVRLRLHKVCPYCNENLNRIRTIDNEEYFFDGCELALESCPNCTYWRWWHVENRMFTRWHAAVLYTTFLGKAREFSPRLPEGASDEIAAWIRRNPKRWHAINPTSCEKLVADIFRANYQHAEVTHVGKPDDGGVDVLFIDADQNQWLIQVKRREHPSARESVTTIRNLLGTMILEGSSYGIVVSTADHFTYRAYQAAKKVNKNGMIVKLIDRKHLDRMMQLLLPERPWLKPIKESFPEYANYLIQKIPNNHYKQLRLL